jgi:hypothetical protein
MTFDRGDSRVRGAPPSDEERAADCIFRDARNKISANEVARSITGPPTSERSDVKLRTARAGR